MSSFGAGSGENSPSASDKRKWCDIESVLDVNIKVSDSLPVRPPVARYLKEVMLGLQGGDADSRLQDCFRRGVESFVVGNVDKLANLLVGEGNVAVPVCAALFWLVIGLVFGRMPSEVLNDFRDQLAQSWYLLTLEAHRHMSKDREARDWALAALPFIFAQAVFRLLCDAFEDDRKHFVGQAEKLLDKLSLVIHFEVTGFQVTSETVKKARKKLFLRNVLVNPQQDLFETEEAKKRQQQLESQNANISDLPLSFGHKDGQALEDTQLEHVMQGRADNRFAKRRSVSLIRAEGSPAFSLDNPDNRRRSSESPEGHRVFVPRDDLSVERYEKLSGNGEAMWGRHLAELQKLLAGPDSEEPTVQLPPALDPWDDPDSAPSGTSSPKSGGGLRSPGLRSSSSGGRNRARISPPGTPAGRSQLGPSFSPSSASRQPADANRPPAERQPPRTITIAGNQVKWPAKSPLVKPPPPVVEWRGSTTSGSPPTEKRSEGQVGDDCEGLTLQLPMKKKSKFPKKKVATVGKLAALWSSNSKDRKERDVRQKRMRHEALHRKITVEPLPQELCEHELVTTWVSPVMKRLASEEDRWSVLRKTRAESRQCKMVVQLMSMPSLLRPSSKEEGTSAGNSARAMMSGRASTAPNRGRWASDDIALGSQGGTSGELSRACSRQGNSRPTSRAQAPGIVRDRSGVLSAATLGNWATGTEARAVGGSRALVLPGKALPRVTSAGSNSGATLGSSLTLEPPSSLTPSVVVNRLEAQGNAFRQTTFAEYMKENDIFTGEPKLRLDDKRLRGEEDSALRKADTIFGGPAKRQLRMQRDGKRQ